MDRHEHRPDRSGSLISACRIPLCRPHDNQLARPAGRPSESTRQIRHILEIHMPPAITTHRADHTVLPVVLADATADVLTFSLVRSTGEVLTKAYSRAPGGSIRKDAEPALTAGRVYRTTLNIDSWAPK